MKYENDFLLKLYKDLLETRLLEIKMTDLYAESRVPGHIHSGHGQEAAFVGVLATRKPGDYFKLPHRVVSSAYLVGDPLDTFFGEILAKKTGNSGAAAASTTWAGSAMASSACRVPWAATRPSPWARP